MNCITAVPDIIAAVKSITSPLIAIFASGDSWIVSACSTNVGSGEFSAVSDNAKLSVPY